MIQIVYRLSHLREVPDGEDVGRDMGIYRTMDDADAAKLRALQLPGFSDHPDGFHIGAYRLNEDHWTSGFFIYQSPD